MPVRFCVLVAVACLCLHQPVSARTQQTLAFGSWFGGFFKRPNMDQPSSSTSSEPKGGRMPSTIDASANNRQTAPHNLRNQQPICEVRKICKCSRSIRYYMATDPSLVCGVHTDVTQVSAAHCSTRGRTSCQSSRDWCR
jgi:hypothetical protein